MRPAKSGSRIEVLDGLRGIAALGVVLYHTAFFLGLGPVFAISRIGYLGVPVFFVISGFIIPHALHASGYRLSDYGRFVAKRMLRLDPPYLASVLLAVLSACLIVWSGLPSGTKLPTTPQVLWHLGFLNGFTSHPWLVAAYWTLAIEFQFYLTMGLVFPALNTKTFIPRALAVGGLCAIALLGAGPSFHLPHYLFLFMLGLAAFAYRAGKIGAKGLIAALGIFGAACCAVDGFDWGLTALGTAVVIVTATRSMGPVLEFLGKISYSLYLLHSIVGPRLTGLGASRFTSPAGKHLLFAVSLAGCIGSAWLFWRFVELPSLRWASRVRYGRKAESGRARAIGDGNAVQTAVTLACASANVMARARAAQACDDTP